MLTYRVIFRPKSATLTPWQADTLFGHLCWQIRYSSGESVLEDFLEQYRHGEPPLLFSNGFPGDLLPHPIVHGQIQSSGPKENQVNAMEKAKRAKESHWVSLEEFNTIRQGLLPELPYRPEVTHHNVTLKNQINRLTGTTSGAETSTGGNLYDVEEITFLDSSYRNRESLDVSVYIKAVDESWAKKGYDYLIDLSQGGYGAKKTSGYGQFSLDPMEQFKGFDPGPDNPNGFISLSNWVPARTDPTRGYFIPMVKYGKLGEELASSDNPFKFPLIMLSAGSSFYSDNPHLEWYGRLIADIAPSDPRVVQYGYVFALPANLVEEE